MLDATITTIIPTYRRPQLLARAISSVLSQSYSNLRVWVLDNCSGDETAEVVQKISEVDSRVQYHCHSNNIGAYKNVEYGIQNVTTPYFSMLSDDDILLPSFFQTVMGGFEAHPQAIFSGGRCLMMSDEGRPLAVMPSPRAKMGYLSPPEGVLSMLSGRLLNHLAITGLVFKTEIVQPMKVFRNEQEGYPSDIEFLLSLAALGPYVMFDDIVLLATMHQGNSSKPKVPMYQGWLGVYQNFISNPNLPEEIRPEVKKRFLAQLRRTFVKIWFRAVGCLFWEEAYILADLLRERLEQEWVGDTLFRATQYFRKNPNSERLAALRNRLKIIDQKYLEPFVEKYQRYSEYLQDASR